VTKKAGADRATRQRLIEVGTRQFAAHGYKHVTIRAICKEARANIAAVNYHFRDKMGFYTEVLDSAFAIARDTTSRAIREGEGLTAEGKLRAYIRVHAEAILAAPGPSALQSLIHREMQEPTVGLNRVIERMLRPRFEYLFGVVGELVGRPANEKDVMLCALSIHGLILMYRKTPAAERMGALLKFDFSPTQVVDHITQFSLAAV
jgi:TetR/AcrR family transcriptional regulator, regulator of cefoperazone and chloramphenicol sensitivity